MNWSTPARRAGSRSCRRRSREAARAADRGRAERTGTNPDGYDESERWVRVTLKATGCPSRENSRFPLTARIERSDFAGADGVDKTVFCRPFRSGVDDVTYACNLELALAHPAEEEADYTIYLMWPGEEETETATWESTCVSDKEQAEGRERDDTLSGHGAH